MVCLKVCSLVLAATLVTIFTAGCGRDLEPILPASGSQPGEAVPSDAILLNVSDASALERPFVLREDVTAARGAALVIEEGRSSQTLVGQVQFPVEAPSRGRYFAWVHVRWNDSCGNSLGLGFAESPKTFVAQDSLYGAWHWVRGGEFELESGPHTLALAEREDGVAVDQLLLTRDDAFAPVRAFRRESLSELRRFGDDFARSPGHGTGNWQTVSGKWGLTFSFDPNRIPNQYAFVGSPKEGPAVALVGGPPWNGCRVCFSVRPTKEGAFGAVLDRSTRGARALTVTLRLDGDRARLRLDGAGLQLVEDLGDSVRLNQWHRLVIERWAWVVRVMLDDRLVVSRFDAIPQAGRVGLFVGSGEAVFDDVSVEEIPWQAEDGGHFRAPWVPVEGAEWYRETAAETAEALLGRNGRILTERGAMRVEEVILDESAEYVGNCVLLATGLRLAEHSKLRRVFRRRHADAKSAGRATLWAAGGDVRIRRVAIRYGRPATKRYRIGPYDFTHSKIEDPSDYLDFTPEEYQRIAQSPEVDKLRRKKKFMPVLGGAGGHSPWVWHGRGHWRVRGGLLANVYPGARLRHLQEIVGAMELSMRLRLRTPQSAAEVALYGGLEGNVRIRVACGEAASTPVAENLLCLKAPADGAWHRLLVRAGESTLSAKLDSESVRQIAIVRGHGGGVFLAVPAGYAQFDDIEFRLPRRSPHHFFYAFDRRETDWWRTGGEWLDHGGVTCALASTWISLVAPNSRGMLWNKRMFNPDVMVAFSVQENTEWFGWERKPSHVHYPFDNIVVALATEADANQGYRLEVNSRNRSATVLYRNGKEVARVSQDGKFPILYTGGHAPYMPRVNRISFIKQGGQLSAIVNGIKVLRYQDPDQIAVRRVGIGGYNTHINFSHVEVMELPRGR